MNAYAIAGTVLCLLGLAILTPTWVRDLKTWLDGDRVDQRQLGEAFCADCPDHEACATGYPCNVVKRAAA